MDSDEKPEDPERPANRIPAKDSNPEANVGRSGAGDADEDNERIELQLARRAERHAFWTMVATGFLAVGTVALAIATFHLASSTVDVAEQTKRVADKTQDLVNLSAEQGVDTKAALAASARLASAAEAANMLSSENSRASISFLPFRVNRWSLNATTLAPDNNAICSYKNDGRSPAMHVTQNAVSQFVPMPPQGTDLSLYALEHEALKEGNRFKQSPTGTIVPPGQPHSFPVNTIEPMDDVHILDYNARKTFLLIECAITYQDFAGREHHVYKAEATTADVSVLPNGILSQILYVEDVSD